MNREEQKATSLMKMREDVDRLETTTRAVLVVLVGATAPRSQALQRFVYEWRGEASRWRWTETVSTGNGDLDCVYPFHKNNKHNEPKENEAEREKGREGERKKGLAEPVEPWKQTWKSQFLRKVPHL